MFPESIRQKSCHDCLQVNHLGFELKMAFQPIIDLKSHDIFAYEALVRGPEGQSAGWVFSHINDQNRYYFDQACRITAIKTAASLGMTTKLSINFMPNAVYKPENCIRATLEAADLYGFDIHNIMFEVVETEEIMDTKRLKHIFDCYQERGFLTAIDDFGSGYATLEWLSVLKPDVLKLDRLLISDIDQRSDKQQALQEIVALTHPLPIRLLAEGVETLNEFAYLKQQGIELFQGYLFARPELESLPQPTWPHNSSLCMSKQHD